jgi:hypothetical protein
MPGSFCRGRTSDVRLVCQGMHVRAWRGEAGDGLTHQTAQAQARGTTPPHLQAVDECVHHAVPPLPKRLQSPRVHPAGQLLPFELPGCRRKRFLQIWLLRATVAAGNAGAQTGGGWQADLAARPAAHLAAPAVASA